MAGEKVWQATEARAQLPAVMEAALAGRPQVIRKRSGEEVVVLSRTDYERIRPTLKDFLLNSAGAAGEDDDAALESALRQVRATGAVGLAPRKIAKRD
jgi:prevent-host-death family protein